jgi:hypothetical protein
MAAFPAVHPALLCAARGVNGSPESDLIGLLLAMASDGGYTSAKSPPR